MQHPKMPVEILWKGGIKNYELSSSLSCWLLVPQPKMLFIIFLLEICFLFFSLCFNSSASLYYGLSDARVIFLPAFQIFVKILKALLSCPLLSQLSAKATSVAILTLVVPDLAWFHTYVLSIDISLEVVTRKVKLYRSFNSQQATLSRSPGNIYQPWPIFCSNNLLWIVLDTLWGHIGFWCYRSMRCNTITAVGAALKFKTTVLYNFIL